jgi:multidrug resistance efflux pump
MAQKPSDTSGDRLAERVSEFQRQLILRVRQNEQLEAKLEKREANFRKVEGQLQRRLQGINHEIQFSY